MEKETAPKFQLFVWTKDCKCQTQWFYVSGATPYCLECGLVYLQHMSLVNFTQMPPTLEDIRKEHEAWRFKTKFEVKKE